MSGPFHQFSVIDNINYQTQIDIHSRLNQHDIHFSKIKEMLLKYTHSQESKTHRYRNKHREILHRPRTGQGEQYYTNTEPYKKTYSRRKEFFYNSYIMDQYSSLTYPRKDYKREGYLSKPHFRYKTS